MGLAQTQPTCTATTLPFPPKFTSTQPCVQSHTQTNQLVIPPSYLTPRTLPIHSPFPLPTLSSTLPGHGQARLRTCQTCMKCTPETRQAFDRLHQLNEWIGAICTTPPTSTHSIQSARLKSLRHTLQQLRIIQWNADNLPIKTTELQSFLNAHKIDIVLLQRTKPGQKDTFPQLLGYDFIRKDRGEWYKVSPKRRPSDPC